MKQILFAIILASISGGVQAQSKDSAFNRQLIESRNFVFKARSASPMRGGLRQLTSEYDVSIKKDSIISWLPYFGRAFVAPVNPSEGSMQFTSTDFVYSSKKTKAHRWEISIKPKDYSEVQEMSFTVYDSGSASLRVTSTNRESISYSGYITNK